MKKWQKAVLIIIVILIIIQFFRPEKNFTTADPVHDIATKYDVPMGVLMNLYDACYDCHSNYTNYPWYYNIQPVGWWMAYHIKTAHKHVNFSEFATYSPKKAAKAFHEIYEVADEHTMPIPSYLLMHDKAHLTDEQYKRLADWAQKMHQKVQAEVDSVKSR